MKFFLLVGGVCGFLLAFISSLYAGKDLSVVIRNSAFWCLVGGLVMKLCYKLLATFIRNAAEARAKGAELQDSEQGTPAPAQAARGPQSRPTK